MSAWRHRRKTFKKCATRSSLGKKRALDPSIDAWHQTAKQSEDAVAREVNARNKYSQPLSLFLARISPFPEFKDIKHILKLKTSPENGAPFADSLHNLCPFTDGLMMGLGSDISTSLVCKYLKTCFERRPGKITQSIVRLLFQSCTWDPTFVNLHPRGREPLKDVLITAIHKTQPNSWIWKHPSVWSVRQVLATYGAVFSGVGEKKKILPNIRRSH